MFSSALRAKLYLLCRNYTALLWGFSIVPAVYLLMIGTIAIVAGDMDVELDPLSLAARASAVGGNPLVHLFVAIGAAAIFGENYRYATWRLVGPRASRYNLLMADCVAFLLASMLMLGVTMSGAVAVSYVHGLASAAYFVSGVDPIELAALFFISSLELLVTGVVVAIVVITTRSPMTSVLVAFFLSFVQSMGQAYAPQSGNLGPLLALPTFAGDTLRTWVLEPQGIPVPDEAAATIALISLVTWCVVGTGFALLVLTRQDWTRE